MTLDDLVKHAQHVLSAKEIALDDVRALASGVMDLFGELSPCGFEEPKVHDAKNTRNGGVYVPASWVSECALDENATREMGRMLFRAADRYETTK